MTEMDRIRNEVVAQWPDTKVAANTVAGAATHALLLALRDAGLLIEPQCTCHPGGWAGTEPIEPDRDPYCPTHGTEPGGDTRRPLVSEMLILLHALVRLYSGGTLSMLCNAETASIGGYLVITADEWWANWSTTGTPPVGG